MKKVLLSTLIIATGLNAGFFSGNEPELKNDPRTISHEYEESMWWQGTKIVGKRAEANYYNIIGLAMKAFNFNVPKESSEDEPLEHAIDTLIEVMPPEVVQSVPPVVKAVLFAGYAACQVGYEGYKITTEVYKARGKKAKFIKGKDALIALYDKQQAEKIDLEAFTLESTWC